jgi:pimeloyl-ACP methyl ester carboxylesterase
MSAPKAFFVEGSPRLHCLEWNPGGGRTILLLHGNSANAWWWAPLAASMAGYRLLAIDLRGHGDSEWVRPPAYGPGDYAHDLARLIETLSLERPIVAGHSMGGIAVTAFTQEYPLRVRAAIAIDIAIQSSRNRDRFMSRLKALPTVNYPDLETAIARYRLMPSEGGIAPDIIEEVARRSVRRLEDGRYTMKFDRESFYGNDGIDVEAALAKVRIPTLLIRGSLSRIMTREAAERAAASNRFIRREMIEGGHHHLPLERPHELAAIISRFAAALD